MHNNCRMIKAVKSTHMHKTEMKYYLTNTCIKANNRYKNHCTQNIQPRTNETVCLQLTQSMNES